MGTSAHLLRKSAPAAVDPLGFTVTMGKTLLNWPSRGLLCSMERTTGRLRYLLRKSAPASGACRRLRLLATNASRLLNARTLAGSSPGAW